jgi:parallel beta-helix repeat protein
MKMVSMNKTALTVILILALAFSAVNSLTSELAKAQPSLPTPPAPFYIESDGSINPLTAPINRVGTTYTLTGDVYNTIEIDASNIVLKGNGFAITNPFVYTGMFPIGWLPGVHVLGVSNVTVTDIAFESCISGVTVENSSAITVSQNTIQDSVYGVAVLSSSGVSITSNNIAVPQSVGASGLIFIQDNPEAATSVQANIEGNLIVGNNNTPSANAQPQQYGIWGGFNDSNMTKNSISGINGIALYYYGSNNLIFDNNFQNSNQGIAFTGDESLSYGNTFYYNNFIDNAQNVEIGFITPPPPSRWDNGTIGNYWSDYNGTATNGGEIGTSPYIIQTSYENYTTGQTVTVIEGQDNYPLIHPVSTANMAAEVPTLPTTLIYPTASSPPSSSPTPAYSTSSSPASTPSISSTPLIPEFSTIISVIVILALTATTLLFTKKLKKRMNNH